MTKKHWLIVLFLLAAIMYGCHLWRDFYEGPTYDTSSYSSSSSNDFIIDVLNGYTPIKDQGDNPTCWAYAMLAAIETEHIMRGDSVNLSPRFALRAVLEEQPENMRGTGYTLLNAIAKHGIVPYDAYMDHGTMSWNRLLETTRGNRSLIDRALGPAPKGIHMLGMRYTPEEFGRSVCAPGEFIGITADPSQPLHTMITADIADHNTGEQYYNVSDHELIDIMRYAVETGHGVCWEGYMYKYWEDYMVNMSVHDVHAMAVVGIAHKWCPVATDYAGRDTGFFIMKNSWGNDKAPLVYIPFDYMIMTYDRPLRSETVAIYVTRECLSEFEEKAAQNGGKCAR